MKYLVAVFLESLAFFLAEGVVAATGWLLRRLWPEKDNDEDEGEDEHPDG